VYIIHLVGKTQITIRLLSIAAVLNIILNLILVPHMGLAGAGIASLIAFSVLGVLTLMVTRRYLKFDLDIPFLLKSLFSSAVMAFCIWLVNPYSIIMIAVSIAAGVIIYFVMILLLRGFSKVELTFFASFIKNYFKRV
jgi:O-antigen/teichoic acid export membrane protein